jgi:hypothetical protein
LYADVNAASMSRVAGESCATKRCSPAGAANAKRGQADRAEEFQAHEKACPNPAERARATTKSAATISSTARPERFEDRHLFASARRAPRPANDVAQFMREVRLVESRPRERGSANRPASLRAAARESTQMRARAISAVGISR